MHQKGRSVTQTGMEGAGEMHACLEGETWKHWHPQNRSDHRWCPQEGEGVVQSAQDWGLRPRPLGLPKEHHQVWLHIWAAQNLALRARLGAYVSEVSILLLVTGSAASSGDCGVAPGKGLWCTAASCLFLPFLCFGTNFVEQPTDVIHGELIRIACSKRGLWMCKWIHLRIIEPSNGLEPV